MALKSEKNKKKPIIFLIIFLIFCILTLFIGFVVPTFDERPTESNTVEMIATIDHIETIKSKSNDFCIIYTKEYSDKIMIHNTRIIIDIHEFNDLEKGESIIFRIEGAWENQFNDMEFIYIVALKTPEHEIVTLESYNELRDNDNLKIKMAASVFAIIFLCASIHCILLLKGVNLFKKKNKLQ